MHYDRTPIENAKQAYFFVMCETFFLFGFCFFCVRVSVCGPTLGTTHTAHYSFGAAAHQGADHRHEGGEILKTLLFDSCGTHTFLSLTL